MSNLISMQWLDFIIADLKHFPTENRKKPYEHFQTALEESGRKMEVLILHIKNELFTVVDSFVAGIFLGNTILCAFGYIRFTTVAFDTSGHRY